MKFETNYYTDIIPAPPSAISKNIPRMGGSPGLVVMGGDSCLKVVGSNPCAVYWRDIFNIVLL